MKIRQFRITVFKTLIVLIILFHIPTKELFAQDTLWVKTSKTVGKFTTWGHDLKQLGNAERINRTNAIKLVFDLDVDILRVPIYNWDHDRNGEIQSTAKYDNIIRALNIIKSVCDSANVDAPILYLSPKLDAPEGKNEWGQYISKNNDVNVKNFYTGLLRAINYYQTNTGLEVKYLAANCEHTIAQFPPDKFNELYTYFKKDKSQIKLVAGESVAVGPYNLEDGRNRLMEYWPDLKHKRKLIKSSHNKNRRWLFDAKNYTADWNGETIGVENLLDHLIEMNQTFYVGNCEGFIFWGDAIITKNSKGSQFRQELISNKNLKYISCSKANAKSKMALITFRQEYNNYFIMTSSIQNFTIIFDREINEYPKWVEKVDSKTFLVKATGIDDYRSGLFIAH